MDTIVETVQIIADAVFLATLVGLALMLGLVLFTLCEAAVWVRLQRGKPPSYSLASKFRHLR